MSDPGPTAGSGLLAEVVALLGAARRAAPDPESAAVLDDARGRIDEPLRVAIAGRVKAGKSTLLNALIGDQLAATDAGECTQIVTWYRNAHSYQVERHDRDGSERPCSFRRGTGLEIDLGGTPATEVDHLVVRWPSARLSDITLIDTPGIGSISTDLAARTYEFLVGDDDPSPADAVLYLLRHLHGSDVRFLEAFHDDDMASGTPVNAVGVLSRADEIGACRLGAMDAARRVAERYQTDPRIRQLCRMVVPVDGLLAQAGATLREQEYRQLATIAADRRHDVVDLTLTADRFVAPRDDLDVAADDRRRLLARLGMFGVRLSLDLVHRRQAASSSALAAELLRCSGIVELEAVLRSHLMARSQALKARSSLATLDALLAGAAWPDAVRLRSWSERISSGAHEIVELQLLTELWLGELTLRDDEQMANAERLLGGLGTAATTRLGLPDD
ncbi:MAG TPA: dynamin family protein, partial [Acidimicrobiales bacterium]|nr:dynamin family protein [Acidimicrobiales bacterium]